MVPRCSLLQKGLCGADPRGATWPDCPTGDDLNPVEEHNVARIEGVDLPRNKPVWIALTYNNGIGQHSSQKICAEAGIDQATRVFQMTDHEVARIREVIQNNYNVEGELRKEVATNIKRLVDLGANRGIRHRRGLPVRGQRTHTNARTRKGPRRTVANKRK